MVIEKLVTELNLPIGSKTTKIPENISLSVDELRAIPGLENASENDLLDIAESIKEFALILSMAVAND